MTLVTPYRAVALWPRALNDEVTYFLGFRETLSDPGGDPGHPVTPYPPLGAD